MIEPSLLRDCIMLGACGVTLLGLGASIGYALARKRYLREGMAQGAALQREHTSPSHMIVVTPARARFRSELN